MTSEKIKEGQKLILKFIGYEFDGKFWIKGARRFCDINIIGDWNHLMRVVDYISDYEIVGEFEITNSCVYIISAMEIEEPMKDILIDHSGGDDKKRAVFEACVEFIKQIK